MPEETATDTPPETAPATAPSAGVRGLLAQAVSALGGQERPGQVQMAEAVTEAMTEGRHLLVQAGTGTGKSLAYLVPALLHDKRVVVATATLALQHQLVERDLPRLIEAVDGTPGVDTSYAVLKGRSNYACLHRIREGVPDDQGVLVDVPAGLDGLEGARAAVVGGEGGRGQGQRRARRRPAAHRPRVAPGQRRPPRLPGRDQVPVRRRSASSRSPARRPTART